MEFSVIGIWYISGSLLTLTHTSSVFESSGLCLTCVFSYAIFLQYSVKKKPRMRKDGDDWKRIFVFVGDFCIHSKGTSLHRDAFGTNLWWSWELCVVILILGERQTLSSLISRKQQARITEWPYVTDLSLKLASSQHPRVRSDPRWFKTRVNLHSEAWLTLQSSSA